jgi:hypothetical protein
MKKDSESTKSQITGNQRVGLRIQEGAKVFSKMVLQEQWGSGNLSSLFAT